MMGKNIMDHSIGNLSNKLRNSKRLLTTWKAQKEKELLEKAVLL